MATVAPKGDGYKITVSLGSDASGRRIRKHKIWKPAPGMTARQIKQELGREAVLFEEKCRKQQTLDGGIRLADFAAMWMQHMESRLRPRTLALYRYLLKRIEAGLGHLPLDRLNPAHVRQFLDQLETAERDDARYAASGDFKAAVRAAGLTFDKIPGVSLTTLTVVAAGGRVSRATAEKINAVLPGALAPLPSPPLSPVTVKKYLRLLSEMLSAAVEWQMIESNPAQRVKPPRLPAQEPRYLDEDQARRLLELLDGENRQHATAVRLLLFTGLRRGELLGLEWPDIDFERGMLYVRRTSQYIPSQGIITDETKNKTSARSVKLPAAAVAALRSHKVWQSAEQLRLGDRWRGTGRLFTAWDGSPMRPDTLSKWFRAFVRSNGLPPISLHSLRHTNATLQIAGGVPLTAVAARLGHASAATTTAVYAHAIRSANEAAAEILQDILVPVR